MSALALIRDLDVPASEHRMITCDVQTLAAALRLSYDAGRADLVAADETHAFLRRTILNMLRSLRRARPVPREGVEAGLSLMLCALDERARVET